MVILRTRNKITDFLMILAWASPFNNPTQNCLNQILIRSGSSWTYVVLLLLLLLLLLLFNNLTT